MSRREFQFQDDQSDKFWIIELRGDSYTVNFGRTGTEGQSRVKSFDSEENAQAEYNKQIASKLKKGYTEIGVGDASPSENKKDAREPKKKATATKKTARKTAANPAPAAGSSEIPELQRVVHTKPIDRFVITWEKHEPLQRPEPKPFDLESCEKRVRSCSTGYYIDWYQARIPESLTPEEAQFWILFAAYSERGEKNDASSIIRRIRKAKLDGKMSFKNKMKGLSSGYRLDDRLLNCFATISSTDEMLEIATATAECNGRYGEAFIFNPSAFRRYVAPYLNADERKRFRATLARAIPNPEVSAGEVSHLYYYAAALGCHDGIQKVVAALADGSFENPYGSYASRYPTHEWLVFGLSNRELVISEARRLKMSLCTIESVSAWIALTGLDALDVIAESICAITNKADATRLAKPIANVIAPEMAAPALRLATESKAAQIGQEWLTNHPLEASVGLAPIARGDNKFAKAARDQLALIQRSGKNDFLEAALPHLELEDAEWLRSEIIENQEEVLEAIEFSDLPEDLRSALAAVKAAKLPAWLNPSALPAIKIGSKRLADSEVASILSAIKSTALTDPSPLMDALKERAEPNSLDTFAWQLFEMWIAMGANSKEKWAMGAIGHLGGDACVLNLTPLVRQWPGESQHQRADFGLKCLRAINSESALMALNGIALKLKFKGLKEKARVAMEEIARGRGLTRDELADRIVPGCGLDESGSREFDFGPRQFKFVLGGESKPMVRGADGKLRANLPKPNKSDDPEKSETALADWKILKNSCARH